MNDLEKDKNIFKIKKIQELIQIYQSNENLQINDKWIKITDQSIIKIVNNTYLDPYKRKLLLNINKPMTPEDIFIKSNISYSTGYKKFRELVDEGFLVPVGIKEQTKLITLYDKVFSLVRFSFGTEEITVEVIEKIYNMKPLDKEPLRFIQASKNDHTLLFYDSIPYARNIQWEFLKKGLDNNEICYFFTENPSNIKNELNDAGINFEEFTLKNQLKIMGLLDAADFFEKYTSDNANLKTRFRIVGDKVLFSSQNDDFKQGCEFEKYIHELFPNFNGNILCSYQVDSINDNNRTKIVNFLWSHHHSVMFAPKHSPGISFNLET